MTHPSPIRQEILTRYARGDLLKQIAYDLGVTQTAVSKAANRHGLRRLRKAPRMPAQASPEPLERVSLNLFKSDVAELKRKLGFGWTGKVRELVREHLKGQFKLDNSNDR